MHSCVTARRSVGLGLSTLMCAALAVGTASPAAAVPAPPTGCAAVEAISVRGSTERQGDGGSIAGPLARSIQSASRQTVRVHDLAYPASLGSYAASVRQGESALRSRLAQTSSSCPSTAFVLTGYSQGAQVIGNVLAAGSVPAADRIRAVVLHGDPAFNGRESYNAGSYLRTRDGIFARRTGALASFAATIRSYCNRTDNFCQRGARGTGHYLYASDRADGTRFAVDRLGG